MNTDVIGEKDGFVIRLAKADDVVNYYEQNYCPLDKGQNTSAKVKAINR